MINPVPERLQKRIEKIGGLADNGKPLFRVMRGSDRFTFIGGRWSKFDESGNRTGEWIGVQQVLKYPEAENRYVFEILCPPENYGTPEEWDAQFTQYIDGQKVETLGPFPRTGEYELVRVLETPTKRAFVPLTEAICDAIVTTAKLNKELPARIRVEAGQKRREHEEIARQQRMVDMINDMSVSKTMRNPHVIIPDMKEVASYGK